MGSSDTNPIPEPRSIDLTSIKPGSAHGGPARLWAIVLAAGVVTGLVAWVGGEACVELIKPPRHNVNSRGIIVAVTDRREVAVADAKNAGLAFALLGIAVGGGLGVAGGLGRRSSRAALWAGLLGVALGAAAGAGMSLALLPLYNTYKVRHPDEASRDLVLPLLVHLGVWSVVGAAGGLTFGVGLGVRGVLPKVVFGGLVGAAVGTAVYELVGAAAFPAAKTAQFVSATWPTRLFARLAVTVAAALGVVLAVAEQPSSPVEPES
jgi:hypothetical protein